MRPLFHPAIGEVAVEAILHALADPVRLAIYAELAGSDAPRSCSSLIGVCDKTVPKSTLSEHFRVLREAGLIRSERRGVEMQSSARTAEIEQRFPGLIPAILEARGKPSFTASRSRAGISPGQAPRSRSADRARSPARKPVAPR